MIESKGEIFPEGMERRSILGPLCIILSLASHLFGCAMNVPCRRPQLGELEGVKDGVVVGDRVFVLSSPQDVLSWCSSYITAFKLDRGSETFSPYYVSELGGKIASKIILVGGKIIVPLQDRNVLKVLDGGAISDTSHDASGDGREQRELSLDVEDVHYVDGSSRAIMIVSLISRKVILSEDIESFLGSGGRRGFVSITYPYVESVLKMPIVVDLRDRSFALNVDRNLVHILPDFRFEVGPGIRVFSYSVSADHLEAIARVTSLNLPQGGQLDEDISLLHPMRYLSGKVFIPAVTLENGEKTGFGVLVIKSDCLAEKMEGRKSDISDCAIFLRSTTGSAVENLEYFNVFVFSQNSCVLQGGCLRGEALRRLSYGTDHEGVRFFVFVFKERVGQDRLAYIDLWAEVGGSFAFFGRRYVEDSPFYQVLDVGISGGSVLVSFIFYGRTLAIESKTFP